MYEGVVAYIHYWVRKTSFQINQQNKREREGREGPAWCCFEWSQITNLPLQLTDEQQAAKRNRGPMFFWWNGRPSLYESCIHPAALLIPHELSFSTHSNTLVPYCIVVLLTSSTAPRSLARSVLLTVTCFSPVSPLFFWERTFRA